MLPNFLVIGAPRSGTTSLYEYVNSHPAIYMSPTKEPDIFTRPWLERLRRANADAVRPLDEEAAGDAEAMADLTPYLALFAGSEGHPIRGEASASYLGDPIAAPALKRYLPDVKMVAILRDPAERMHSHYVHHVRILRDQGATEEGIAALTDTYHRAIDDAVRHGFDKPATNDPEVWIRAGFYHRHITRYRSIFPEEQLRIYWFEDLAREPRQLAADVFRFLGVDDTHVLPTTEAFNASVVPNKPRVFRLFTRRNPVMRFARAIAPTRLRAAAMNTRNRLLASGKPQIGGDVRHKLVAIYREDILKLQDLMGRDLSAWLAETQT